MSGSGGFLADWTRGEKRFLAGAMLVALVLRYWHWSSFAPHAWFDFLGLDAKYYDEWAQRILREGLQGSDPYFMGPLYPHLLSGVYAMFGRSLDAVRHLQIGLSVATLPLLHALARAYGGRTLACVASGAAAVYGPFIYYSVSLLYPTLTIFLATALLLLLHESARRGSSRWAFGAGLVLGIYALGRGNIFLFAPIAFFWLITSWGAPFSPKWSRWRTGLRGGIPLAAGTIVAILPATIHNARAGDPTLLTTNGGLNFYIGNGPMASGGHETPVLYWEREDGTVETIVADLHQDVECRTEAEQALGRKLSYTEVSAFWFDQTVRYLARNPGMFFSRLLMKTVHFWSTYEIPQIEHFGYFRQFSTVLRGPALTFGLLGPLAVVGMALGLREWRRWLLLYLFVIGYSTSIVLFFVLARYRLPVLPALIPFAAMAAITLVDAGRRRRWGLAAGGAAGAIVVGWAMSANFYGVDETKGIAQIIYRHGIVEDSEENWAAAIEHYEEALRLKPGYDKAHLNLGIDLARLGRREEGLRHLEQAEEINPLYYRAPFNRGLLLEELGREAEAREAYARSVELEPNYLLGISALAELELLDGNLESARARFEGILAYDGRWEGRGHETARTRARRALTYLGWRDRLATSGQDVCFTASEAFRRVELARLRGRREQAFQLFRRYFEEGGACPEAYLALGRFLLERNEIDGGLDALERARAADPAFPSVHLELARVAASRRDPEEAIRLLERELTVSPDDPLPLLEMGLVHERLLEDPATAQTWYEKFRKAGGDPDRIEARRGTWRGPPSP